MSSPLAPRRACQSARTACLVVGVLGACSGWVSQAAAQSADHVVLLVRVSPARDSTLEGEEDRTAAVRELTGAPVRRIDPTLDDLAIAAGCTTPADEAECLARVASAGRVSVVAIERGCGAGEPCSVTLHGADGTRLRQLTLDETPAEPTLDTTDPAQVAQADRTSTTRTSPLVENEPRRAFRLELHHGLYAGAIVSSFGAFVCGGLAIDAGQRASGLGVVRDSAGVDTLLALEEQRTVTLVLASAFAVSGAALAVVGWIVQGQPLPGESDVFVSVGATPDALAVAAAGRF